MPNFEAFLMRHSESLIQDIVERIERNEGIVTHYGETLEDRWNALMQGVSGQQRLAA